MSSNTQSPADAVRGPVRAQLAKLLRTRASSSMLACQRSQPCQVVARPRFEPATRPRGPAAGDSPMTTRNLGDDPHLSALPSRVAGCPTPVQHLPPVRLAPRVLPRGIPRGRARDGDAPSGAEPSRARPGLPEAPGRFHPSPRWMSGSGALRRLAIFDLSLLTPLGPTSFQILSDGRRQMPSPPSSSQ
jgi:hypothetical protein